MSELSAGTSTAIVRGPDLTALQHALAEAGMRGSTDPDGTLRVRADELTRIGHLAFVNGVELHELSLEEFDLEQLFFSLTEGAHTGVTFADQAPAITPPGGYGQAAKR
jgi:ABC-2 type transport system ATP-binding protein